MDRRTIFRVVERGELEDVRLTGRLRPAPSGGSYEGKLFWQRLEDARRWKSEADRFFGVPPERTILAVSLPTGILERLDRVHADRGVVLSADRTLLSQVNDDVEFREEEPDA